jgi:hypothetical protein
MQNMATIGFGGFFYIDQLLFSSVMHPFGVPPLVPYSSQTQDGSF